MKVQRFTFAVDFDITIGRQAAIERTFPLKKIFEKDGVERFRLQRPTTNIRWAGLVFLSKLSIDDANIIGAEPVDACIWRPESVGNFVDCRDIGVDSVLRIEGSVTDLVPPGLYAGRDFCLMLSFTGPINEKD